MTTGKTVIRCGLDRRKQKANLDEACNVSYNCTTKEMLATEAKSDNDERSRKRYCSSFPCVYERKMCHTIICETNIKSGALVLPFLPH